MNDKIVFITQVPMRRDKMSGELGPAFNTAPAAEHGSIEILCAPGPVYDVGKALDITRKKLKRYDFERGDSVLLAGDPVLMALVGAVLRDTTNAVRFLRWDRNISRYIPVRAIL